MSQKSSLISQQKYHQSGTGLVSSHQPQVQSDFFDVGVEVSSNLNEISVQPCSRMSGSSQNSHTLSHLAGLQFDSASRHNPTHLQVGSTCSEQSMKLQPKGQSSLMDLVSEAACKSGQWTTSHQTQKVKKEQPKMSSLIELLSMTESSESQSRKVQLKPATALAQPLSLTQLMQQEKESCPDTAPSLGGDDTGRPALWNKADSPSHPVKSTVQALSSISQALSSPKKLSLSDLAKLDDNKPATACEHAQSALGVTTLSDLVHQHRVTSTLSSLSQVASTHVTVGGTFSGSSSTREAPRSAITFQKAVGFTMKRKLTYVIPCSVKADSNNTALLNFQRSVYGNLSKRYLKKLLINFDFSTMSPDDNVQERQHRAFHK